MSELNILLHAISKTVLDGGPGSGRKPTGHAKKYQPTGRPVGRPKGSGKNMNAEQSTANTQSTASQSNNSGIDPKIIAQRAGSMDVKQTKEYFNALRNYYLAYDEDAQNHADPETTAKAMEAIDIQNYIDSIPNDQKTDIQWFYTNCMDIDDDRFDWNATKRLYKDLIPEDDHSDSPQKEETYYPSGPNTLGIAYPWRD